jgi:DNA repair exonuclease SbcCD nuclease subunit
MVPYTTPEDFWATIARMSDIMPDDSPPVWWTHQGWSGAYLNNMVKDRDGLSPARIKAEAVITGHYHMPQNIGPIIYCGSPYQTTFAEEGQAKSWLRFDGKSNIPTRVPYQSVGAPNHWTIHWDPATGDPTIPDGYTDGDKLRVVTTATKSVVKASRGQLKSAGLDGVPVLAKPDTAIRRVIARSASPVEAALQYVESSHGPDAGMPTPANMEEWAEESGLWD